MRRVLATDFGIWPIFQGLERTTKKAEEGCQEVLADCNFTVVTTKYKPSNGSGTAATQALANRNRRIRLEPLTKEDFRIGICCNVWVAAQDVRVPRLELG